jgi:hypothetical protein
MAATPASMLRIVSDGLQDRTRLNTPVGRPSVDFYRAVLRRRTRWASQWRRVEFDNLADFGRRATVTLPILGELITRVTLVVDLPDLYGPQYVAAAAALTHTVGLGENNCLIGPQWSWTNALGHAIASEIELTIGDTVVDRLDSRLLEVLDEQTAPVEHWDSTNAMIGRNPTNFAQFRTTEPSRKQPTTLEIVPPFWFNRGPGPQALPIQALNKDKVQITVSFRPVQECVYTDARVDARNPPLVGATDGPGPMPTMAGCGFYQHWPGGVPIYSMTRETLSCGGTEGSLEPTGRVLPGRTMPRDWHFRDAYWIVEYVSLEDREAAAFRMVDLQIPIEQHVAVPMTPTDGRRNVRVPLPQGGLVRDMTWVAQRTEATDYNAYFLFSRDLGPPDASGSFIPWWPDAIVPDWDYGDGYIQPGFATRRSDPISAATLWTRAVRRFEHEGPSLFRSLIPALNCQRCPLVDRYIYRYDFGFWPTGGLEEALGLPLDQVRGFSNWDKLPQKELALTMNTEACERFTWETDPTQAAVLYPADTLAAVESNFAETTAAFRVELVGAGRQMATDGSGASVSGIVDYQAVRRLPGWTGLWVRTNTGGSAALVAVAAGAGTATWIAVAGAGGAGTGASVGGAAGSAVEIAWQGGGTARTHATGGAGTLGGGGGGRLAEAGVGQPDGQQMLTTVAFALSHTQTGGATAAARGGDGYTGGGSGSAAGGGGGSYVSRLITGVESIGSLPTAGDSWVRLTPLRRVTQPPPTFNIYVWLTTYNILRITSGRGALLFSA